jgi:hypothetical protein
MEKGSPENIDLQGPDQASRPPLNVWERLAGVLTSPRQTFADIVAYPRFAAGLAVLCAVNLLTAILILPKLRTFTLWSLAQQVPQLGPGAAMAQEVAVGGATFGAIVGALAGPPLYALLMAVLLFFFGFLAKNRTPFRVLYAVGVFAYVPATIASIVTSALIATRPAEQFNQVTISLAMFLPAGAEGLPHRFLAQVSPLGLWSLALVALGGAVAYKTSFGKAAVYLLVLWAIYVAVAALVIPSFFPGFASGF